MYCFPTRPVQYTQFVQSVQHMQFMQFTQSVQYTQFLQHEQYLQHEQSTQSMQFEQAVQFLQHVQSMQAMQFVQRMQDVSTREKYSFRNSLLISSRVASIIPFLVFMVAILSFQLPASGFQLLKNCRGGPGLLDCDLIHSLQNVITSHRRSVFHLQGLKQQGRQKFV